VSSSPPEKPPPAVDGFVVIWRGLSVAFWVLFGGAMLAASGWIIFATLETVVRRDLLGQKYYVDTVHNWPFFFGCVVIFVLCAYALLRSIRRFGEAERARKTSSSS
jgi:hypothetical protein